MSERLAAYRRARNRKHDLPVSLSEGEDLVATPDLPAAAIRGALSFYDDTQAIEDAVRVCHGTSCTLAGASETRSSLEKTRSCRTAYCLGYCDQAPAILLPDGRPVTHATPETLAETLTQTTQFSAMPDIRAECDVPIITERIAKGDHAPLDKARTAGVYAGLQKVMDRSPESVVQALDDSGERGRGGAAYPTAAKWRQCAAAVAPQKYVVANGDEGDPGSFIDRTLMEFDPHTILEGMAIAAYAVGANEGIVFIRSEYPQAAKVMKEAIREAASANFLGADILGSGFDFNVRVFTAMGSYVCGEETAMLNAIEGQRGEVQLRPPYPAVEGLYGMPTLVDNVETLANVPWIMRNGPDAYRALGTEASSGTKAICLNSGFARPGIVEIEFGDTIRKVIEDYGEGGVNGKEIEAVIMGGPMGSVVGPVDWDVPICYDATAQRSLALGHGGMVAIHEGADWEKLLLNWLEFMAHESCGKCVPCKLGSNRALEIARAGVTHETRGTLEELFDLMADGSLCAFGQQLPLPMQSILNRALASRTD